MTVWRALLVPGFPLLPLLLAAQTEPLYWDEDDEEWVVRSVGGMLGIGIDDHGPMDLADFAQFSKEPLPPPPGNIGDYYFGINSISLGVLLGPRVTMARMRHGEVEETKGWEFHLGIDPRFFFQYYYLDSAANDTLFTTEYLYLMGQLELVVGGGPYWRTQPTRSFYLTGSFNGELGLAFPGLIAISGTRTASLGSWEQSTDLLDHTAVSRGCTYLRGFATGEVGFRIRRRVDLGFRIQLGTGLMWIHGADMHPLMASRAYMLHAQWLMKR